MRDTPVDDTEGRTEDCAGAGGEISDQAIEALKRERFQQRVQRVLEVMQRERVDWRGVAYIAPDGRVGARVVPVEMERP